jgi:hypothetical protein
VIARKWRAPVLEHANKASAGDISLDLTLWQICKPEPSQSRVQSQTKVVKHELTFDADLQLTAALFELPSEEAAIGGQAKVDALMRGEDEPDWPLSVLGWVLAERLILLEATPGLRKALSCDPLVESGTLNSSKAFRGVSPRSVPLSSEPDCAHRSDGYGFVAAVHPTQRAARHLPMIGINPRGKT